MSPSFVCRHAFAADSLLSLVYQIVRGNFPPIPTDQFSNGLSDLVNRLLWRDPATRPSLSEVRSRSRSAAAMRAPGWLGALGWVLWAGRPAYRGYNNKL